MPPRNTNAEKSRTPKSPQVTKRVKEVEEKPKDASPHSPYVSSREYISLKDLLLQEERMEWMVETDF